ncbi:hypothetical protein GCM10010309_65040 [Streptomyces violaceochromogenes]|nr:hypothetical protein GCM10010309_65040 [Streptomyces violaceochromogenes]
MEPEAVVLDGALDIDRHGQETAREAPDHMVRAWKTSATGPEHLATVSRAKPAHTGPRATASAGHRPHVAAQRDRLTPMGNMRSTGPTGFR